MSDGTGFSASHGEPKPAPADRTKAATFTVLHGPEPRDNRPMMVLVDGLADIPEVADAAPNLEPSQPEITPHEIELMLLADLDPTAYDHQRKAAAKARGVRLATLDDLVEAQRTIPSPAPLAPNPAPPPIPVANLVASLADSTGQITEDSAALAFTRKHRDELRFDHHAGAWYRWTGSAWAKESTKLAYSWARHTARKLARQTMKKQDIAKAGTAAFSAGVERFAQSDRAFAVTSAIWDNDPWLLGTPGGTVDLRTGAMYPARPADHITKLTSVTPAATANCPKWLAFLDQATDGDQEFVGFLKRWFGYCLSGITREHALLFVFGDGGNGKGVAMVAVAGVMGDYAVAAPMDTFAATKNEKHPTDMAMLAGARMVMVNEVEEGQGWAEARLKALTGGDPITARFMRRDFFTYFPAFKLTISGNHKPGLKNVDEAVRRRVKLAPFLHKPPVVDNLLTEKLKAEWPDILRWMIEGCLEWQRDGLGEPEAVREATEAYFEAQDTTAKWLAERCKIYPTLEVRPGVLMADYRYWAASNGEEVPTTQQFRGAIERVRGVRYVTVRGLVWVKGIGLNPPPDDQGRAGWSP